MCNASCSLSPPTPDKGADLEKNAFSEGSLRELLMNDEIIIDSSLLQVTTIIGQGTAAVVQIKVKNLAQCSANYHNEFFPIFNHF